MENRNIIVLLFLVILLPLVFAELSGNGYKVTSYALSSGGTNVTSTNYKTDFLMGEIAWSITSALYKLFLGFWYMVIDVNPPKWNNNQTNLTGDDRINEDRWFYINWSDNVGLSHYIFSWNGTNGTWINDTAVEMRGTINQSNVTKTINLTRNNTIGWIVYANDTAKNWNNTVFWTFVVNNTPPSTPVLSLPINNTQITNTTPRFNWTNATDADNDTAYYDIFIKCLGGCSVDNREAYNLTDANYTPSEPLRYYDDDGYKYEWWVRAFDNISYGVNSSHSNFSISSSVVIGLPTMNVSFGTMNVYQQNDTTDDNPSPIAIQNDGNCYINVNISADSYIWESNQSPSKYFQFKVDNVSTEKGAFNSSDSATSWTFFNSSYNTTSIIQLNYSDATDSAEIDINLTVPEGEPPGDKQSSVIFTGYYVMVI